MSITDEPREYAQMPDVKQVMERLRVSKSFAYELITTSLKTENAKLQDENARLRSRLSDEFAENARMTVENAKLRELTKDMFNCIANANEQDWFYFERDKTGCGMSCTVNGEECGLLVLANRLRELGIEVD